MSRLVMAAGLLSGNFIYQIMSTEPDYARAVELSFFQAHAMLFIIFYPKFIEWTKK